MKVLRVASTTSSNIVFTFTCCEHDFVVLGLVPVEGDPSNKEVGPSSLENENGGKNRFSFFLLVGRKHVDS